MAPYYHAQAEFLRSVAPSPWQHVALADESLRAYERMGDLRHVCSVLFVKGQNLTELGAIASGEVALRESVALAQRLKQPFLLSQARLHLAAALASRKEEGLREEAMRSCEELLGSPGIRPGFRGWAHSIRARALLFHGDARAAEAEARKGIELSASVPLRLLLAIADLCHALLHQSRAEDARSLAEEALSRLTKLGGAGYSELPVRLALAEARHAAGDSVGAAQALRSAAEELHRRAELIPDPAVRAHYLTTVPEHARIRELCSAGDVAASG